MNDFMRDDPLERLLGAGEAESPALRERLRQETLGCVRRRRRVRRLWQASAAAACVLVACFVIWHGMRSRVVQDPEQNARHNVAEVKPAPAPQPVPQPEAIPVAAAPAEADPLTAAALEWRAFDSQGEERSRRYFEAGDRYLEVERDYASALRCYSQALADARPGELEFATDENWMVWMVLKLKNPETRN